MSKAEAEKMITDAIAPEWLANVLEVDMGRNGTAYIAELNRGVCLGSPTVVIEKSGEMRYASVVEARRITRHANERNLLTPGLYR